MLNIDQFFFKALTNSQEIEQIVDYRIFNTARDKASEDEDRVPYIIIWFDGATADDLTKDNRVSEYTSADVCVLCCATDREELAELTELVDKTIRDSFAQYDTLDEDNWNFHILSATPHPERVEMDIDKPCYFQTITYQCNTNLKQ